MRFDDLVSPPAGADFSRSRFQSFSSSRWVHVVGRLPSITGVFYGWPRRMRRLVFPPSVLTLSWRCHFDSFRVAIRCAMPRLPAISTPSPSPALPIALPNSFRSPLWPPASYLFVSTPCWFLSLLGHFPSYPALSTTVSWSRTPSMTSDSFRSLKWPPGDQPRRRASILHLSPWISHSDACYALQRSKRPDP